MDSQFITRPRLTSDLFGAEGAQYIGYVSKTAYDHIKLGIEHNQTNVFPEAERTKETKQFGY